MDLSPGGTAGQRASGDTRECAPLPRATRALVRAVRVVEHRVRPGNAASAALPGPRGLALLAWRNLHLNSATGGGAVELFTMIKEVGGSIPLFSLTLLTICVLSDSDMAQMGFMKNLQFF